MATLADVTKKSKSLADTISKTVASYAPKKAGKTGGNLRERLRESNNINTMFEVQGGTSKELDIKSLVFSYNYAPDDAPYGMYWNDPTVSNTVKNQRTGNKDKINFAEKGLEDPKVIKALDELTDLVGEMVLEKINNELSLMESEY